MRTRLKQSIRSRAELPLLAQLAVGAAAGVLAVAIRMALPLGSQQLPTLTVVVTLAIVTAFIGAPAGIATAVFGGLLSWYLLFDPMTWSLTNREWIPLLGFAVIATTIISTASLYRTSERRWHEALVNDADRKAEDAILFAREMAHRLKNALSIVQSMAFQTIGHDDPKSLAFAARLRTLADANELLSEHVSKPTAPVREVVSTALAPFTGANRLTTELADASISGSQVISLALALHELATNATKYGAWSVAGGTVDICINDADGDLKLSWTEQGGPAVASPPTRGFGSRLLERAGKNPKLEFHPSGIAYTVDLRRAG